MLWAHILPVCKHLSSQNCMLHDMLLLSFNILVLFVQLLLISFFGNQLSEHFISLPQFVQHFAFSLSCILFTKFLLSSSVCSTHFSLSCTSLAAAAASESLSALLHFLTFSFMHLSRFAEMCSGDVFGILTITSR